MIKDNEFSWWNMYTEPPYLQKKFQNSDEFIEYLKNYNIDIDILLKAINQDIEKPYNVYNEFFKQGTKMKDNELLEIYRDIKAENKIIYNKIETTKWLLTALITLFGIFTPLMFSLHARSIDAKFETLNTKIEAIDTNINSKFDLIQQQLDTQKELNQLQIQRDVSQEILNQKH